MADAPSGGSKIGGPEIILIIVLVLGVYGVLSGNPLKPFAPTTPTTPSTNKTTATTQCGIILTRPTKSEKIHQVVTITGTITPCNSGLTTTTTTNRSTFQQDLTAVFSSQSSATSAVTITAPAAMILHAQVVDRNGTPMSAYTPITVGATSYTSSSFDIDIPITGAPAIGTGYVIVVGPVNPDGTSLTARVPILF